jgi:hypothetical protein
MAYIKLIRTISGNYKNVELWTHDDRSSFVTEINDEIFYALKNIGEEIFEEDKEGRTRESFVIQLDPKN